MIFITQLIYIHDLKEETFQEFENVAIPIISKYGGTLLLRIRPDDRSFIEANMEKPYEVHLVSFPSEVQFHDFMNDGERKQFLHLKEASIKLSVLIKGERL